jgi:hypothetical protein
MGSEVSDLTGDLLREVARVQKERTLLEVRAMLEHIHMTVPRRNYGSDPKTCAAYKAEVITGLEKLRAKS